MVVPLWFRGFSLSVALEKRDGELRGLSVTPCLFIPLRGAGQPIEGYFPVGDPPDEYLNLTIGLDQDDIAFRQSLRLLFSQDATLREAGRSLEGQFHTQDIYSGLVMSLTVDPRVFIIYSASQSSLIRGFGYALIDLDSMSAAVICAAQPEGVVVYGDDTAYGELINLLDHWDRLGQPLVHDLSVQALFDAPESVPEGHWIINKRPPYTWVFSWSA